MKSRFEPQNTRITRNKTGRGRSRPRVGALRLLGRNPGERGLADVTVRAPSSTNSQIPDNSPAAVSQTRSAMRNRFADAKEDRP
jgi:hypothetical protein